MFIANTTTGRPDSTTDAGTTMRVRARQERSLATLDGILLAAGQLFDEVGPDATTMEAIAQRAGVSIGSVYRFFENRAAVEATLRGRVRSCLAEATLSLFDDTSLRRRPEAVVSDHIERVRGVLAAVPGTRGLLASAIARPSTETLAHYTPQIERLIDRYAPGLTAQRRQRAARTYLMSGIGLTIDAVRSRDDSALGEACTVLVGYLRELRREARAGTA
jgi:AcrR family transcriptional regulator